MYFALFSLDKKSFEMDNMFDMFRVTENWEKEQRFLDIVNSDI